MPIATTTEIDESSMKPMENGRRKWTPFLVYCNLVIILGSAIPFGFNLSVMNGPFAVMASFLNETFHRNGQNLTQSQLNSQWSLAVSLYLIGGIVGSTWFPNYTSSYYGKRKALIFAAMFGVVGEALLFMSRLTVSSIPFFAGRAIAGFQGGFSIVIGPALLNEHAPAQLRGACGTLFTLGMATGVELGNLLGLGFILGSANLWHYLFLVLTGIFLIHAIGLVFIAESPRWLVDQGQEAAAFKALAKLRNGDETSVRAELDEIKETSRLESAKSSSSPSVKSIFGNRQFWWPLVIVINLHITNQLTGVGAILTYATMVMNRIGIEAEKAAIANFVITFAMIVTITLCTFTVDRFGRRPLLLIGTLGMVLVNIILVVVLYLNIYQASIACFAVALFLFGLGPGPIPWFLPAEMFNQATRPMALAIGIFTNYVCNILVSFGFPEMQFYIGYYAFLPFAVIGFLEFVFLFTFLPETTPKLAPNYNMEIFATGRSLVQFRRKSENNDEKCKLIVNDGDATQ